MRVPGSLVLLVLGAAEVEARFLSSDHAAVASATTTSTLSPEEAATTTTMVWSKQTTSAPLRKVPDRLYKPMDSFGSKVELHSDDKKSEKEGGKAQTQEDADVKSAEKVEKSEKAEKVEKVEKTEKVERAEDATGKEAETDKEAKKIEEAKAKEVEPAGTPAPADTVPPAPAPKLAVGPEREFDHAAYEEDWHSEWSHGDYPSYKETHNAAEKIEQYEDRQSDGKASKPGGKYAKKEKKEDPK